MPTPRATPDHEGHIALVTGAAGGIGGDLADRLRATGTRVAYADLVAPTDFPATETSMVVDCDVTDAASVDTAFDAVETRWGPVDILVCSAGMLHRGTVEETGDDVLAALLEVNVAGTYRCIRRALPEMRKGGSGRILVMASVAGLDGGSAGLSAYAMTKGAVIALTRAVARETVGQGITVNALAPALIETAMTDGLYSKPAPVGRAGRPSDVTHLAMALLADASDYVTGQVIRVDGGFGNS